MNSEGSETNHVLFSLYFFFRFGWVWFVRVCFRLGLQCSRRLGSNPVLDRTSILFIKSEFHCERFALLRNSSISALATLLGTWQPIGNIDHVATS